MAEVTKGHGRRPAKPRARRVVEAGRVVPVEGWGYMVKSRTTGGWWLVDGDGCDCPATTRRCWHIRQVEDHVRAVAAKYPPRPRGTVNASMFVD